MTRRIAIIIAVALLLTGCRIDGYRMARAAYTALGWAMEPLLWLRHLCDEWELRAIRRQRRRRSDAP